MSNFMYGLLSVKIGEQVVGYIEENSFAWNGSEGEITEVYAAQVHSAAVHAIPKKNGTIAPSFDLIEMDYKALALVLGGETIPKDPSSGEVTGWKAPTSLIQVVNAVEIKTDSSHKISIPKALITAYIDGNLNLDSVSKIKVKLKVLQPDTKSAAPYTIETVSG